ncbi:Myblike DNAbinding domain-containing protein [Actinomortierella ambigua]|uniref:Myblike DNAbinding domain-containing protein n=1 Tax=Actinomortierella ambigua TaxID=1343610 RepID=A0A9P6QDK8_9FUNG|nr:Myblike DNAbinding domain-containing protein [Actinomortierella ambigua]
MTPMHMTLGRAASSVVSPRWRMHLAPQLAQKPAKPTLERPLPLIRLLSHVSSVLNTKRTRRPWQLENDVKLLELRRQGWSWKAVAQFFGRSQTVVRRRFNGLLGLGTYGRHGPSSSSNALGKQMEVLKIWINEQGMSWEQAAMLLDTKVPILQHRLRVFQEEQEDLRVLLQTEDEGVKETASVADRRKTRQPTRVRFSQTGEAKLLQAIEQYGTDDWETIAEQVFDNKYTPHQLRRKFIKIKHWNRAREDRLMSYVSLVDNDPKDVRNDAVWQAAADEIAVKEGVQYTPAECRDKWIDVVQRMGVELADWSRPWSDKDIDAFWKQWKTHGQDWEAIAGQLERRTAKECRQRFSYLLKDVSKKGPKDPDEIEALRTYFSTSYSARVNWTTDMQDRLFAAVQAWRDMGKGMRINWKWVARRVDIPGVTGRKCLMRWNNYHLKDLRRPNSMGFSEEEDQKLMKAVADYQQEIWIELARRGLFADRPAEALQARWDEIRDSLVRVGSSDTRTVEDVQEDIAKMVRQQFRVEPASKIPLGLLPGKDELLQYQAESSMDTVSDDSDQLDSDQPAQDRGVIKKWTEEEAQQLKALLAKYGQSTIAWQFIAQILGTTPGRCKSRWRRKQ